jgi:hypothetical protein
MTTQTDWLRHDDPRGFTVQHPRGWTVHNDDATRRIVVGAPEQGVFALVQPFAGDTVQFLRAVPELLGDVFPDARMGRAEMQPGKPHKMIGSLEFRAQAAPARATFICAGTGRGGAFYAIAAPTAIFERARGTLSAVLESLHFSTPAAAQNAPQANAALEFTRWTDPLEGAYSLELPRTWKIEGGLFRAGLNDIRPETRFSTPDGSVQARFGDRNLPRFTTPTMLGMSLGVGQGQWYAPASGFERMVWPYIPGARFALEHVQNVVTREFGPVQIQGTQDQPTPPAYGSSTHAGEVRFTTADGRVGYWFALTSFVPVLDGGNWEVTELRGYVCRPEAQALAEAVSQRARASVQWNPQWNAGQRMGQNIAFAGGMDFQRQQAQVGQAQLETIQHSSQLQQQTTDDRWRVQDEQARHFGNLMSGTTDVADTTTGQTWNVTAGNQHYWRANHQDVIVRTDLTDDLSPMDFTRLKEY